MHDEHDVRQVAASLLIIHFRTTGAPINLASSLHGRSHFSFQLRRAGGVRGRGEGCCYLICEKGTDASNRGVSLCYRLFNEQSGGRFCDAGDIVDSDMGIFHVFKAGRSLQSNRSGMHQPDVKADFKAMGLVTATTSSVLYEILIVDSLAILISARCATSCTLSLGSWGNTSTFSLGNVSARATV